VLAVVLTLAGLAAVSRAALARPAAVEAHASGVGRPAEQVAARAPTSLGELAPAGAAWHTVRVDGVVRRYLLSVPTQLHGPAPVVVAFHGLGQTAPAFAARTGLVPATRAAGVVLALPESLGPAFDDGRLGTGGPHDDAFCLALIRQLVDGGTADPQRVVLAGFSNGAGMAMEVAGRHPGTVSTLVAIAGDLIAGKGAPRPTGPVRTVLLHGTADRVQPWNGRPARGPLWPAYIPVTAVVDQWVRADRAGAATVRTEPGAAGRERVTVLSWQPGPTGAGVTFYQVSDLGHLWPLGPSSLPGRPGGTDAVDATTLVVQAAEAATSPADAPGR
jgi:polyhydroxybutyrate depolymerase